MPSIFTPPGCFAGRPHAIVLLYGQDSLLLHGQVHFTLPFVDAAIWGTWQRVRGTCGLAGTPGCLRGAACRSLIVGTATRIAVSCRLHAMVLPYTVHRVRVHVACTRVCGRARIVASRRRRGFSTPSSSPLFGSPTPSSPSTSCRGLAHTSLAAYD